MTDTELPRLAELDPLATRLLEHAAAELEPARTTLELTGYADGDYELRAYETVSIRSAPDGDGDVWERIEIRYNRQLEWIQRCHYRENDRGRFDETVTDLEAYPDPTTVANE
ncbi:hypothetical protein [Natronococcus occultus]|uniref:Uncharacterized protein n=1 Tax=Natronococcus occultus SP4 TaxID=694430 RepID=L0JWR5_9EURY|nr:hypothetical protein [Natronococcus occultus]AGB36750.1 hypothetical protein Natoc_0901 [Natronococcus occultus SP4]